MSERREPGPRSREIVAREAAPHRAGLPVLRALLRAGHGARPGLRRSSTRTATSTSTSSRASRVGSVGHCHPHYVEALKRQVERLTFGSFTTETRARFLELLGVRHPRGPRRASSSSRAARRRWRPALRLAKAATGKHEVIGFWGGFHGKTGGVLGPPRQRLQASPGARSCPASTSTPYADCYRCPLQAHAIPTAASPARTTFATSSATRPRARSPRSSWSRSRAPRATSSRPTASCARSQSIAKDHGALLLRRRDDHRLRAHRARCGAPSTTASCPTS